jgi:hypothetical protein
MTAMAASANMRAMDTSTTGTVLVDYLGNAGRRAGRAGVRIVANLASTATDRG